MDIKTIKQNNDIRRVIGRYVALEEKGGKAVGLCPFHEDHHPSLWVDPVRQTFCCFACGAKGDVFSFLQRHLGVGFAEAAKQLTVDNGQLTIKKAKADTQATSAKPNCQLSTVNCQLINEGLLRLLMPYSPGFSELTDTYLSFEVGLAPHLLPRQWQKFAGRIIFPIRDAEGVLVGFAGRSQQLTVDNGQLTIKEATDAKPNCQLSTVNCQLKSQLPKYLNSSKAEGYDKGGTLYALHRAKEAIARTGEVFIVEGYKDAIAMHAAGFTQTVAICGTAFTEGQRELLAALEPLRVYLLLDADNAGGKAAEMICSKPIGKPISSTQYAGSSTEREGVDSSPSCVLPTASCDSQPTASCLFLPSGEDPDSLFRRLGREAFAEHIRSLAPSVEMMTAALIEKMREIRSTQYAGSSTEREGVDSSPSCVLPTASCNLRLVDCLECETLLRTLIPDLCRQIRRIPSNDIRRQDMQQILQMRTQQLRFVSLILNRPGAV